MAGLDEMRWVAGADPLCQAAGCKLLEARVAIAQAEMIGRMGQRMEVDDVALWCGVGGHAFSGRDPGRQKVTVQQWDADSQEMKPVTVSACGEHARPVEIQTRPKPSLLPGRRKHADPVTDPDEARQQGYDPEYVAWLERKNGLAGSGDG